jgi:hypothetical protein
MTTPAEDYAAAIAACAAHSRVIEIPTRAATWRVPPGESPSAGDIIERSERDATRIDWKLRKPSEQGDARAEEMRARIGAVPCPHGVFVAVQGVCRIMLGGQTGQRGTGERFTGLVVHVIADGEPSRAVLLSTEA